MSRRRVAVVVGLLVLSLAAPAHADAQQRWAHGVVATDSACGLTAVSTAVDTGNGRVFSAFRQGACGPNAPLLEAYSRSGTRLWTYDTATSDDAPVEVAVDASTHRVLMVTTRNGDDLLVQAFDGSTGAHLWGRGFIAIGTANLAAVGLALGAGGQVIAIGTVTRSGVPAVTLVSLRQSDGTTRWHVRYDDNGDVAGAVGYDVATDPAHNRAYLLASTSSGSGENPVTVAYDTRTGDIDWQKHVTSISATPTAVVVDTSAHEVYSVVSNRNTAEADTYAYADGGGLSWNRTYDTDGFEPYRVAVDSGNHQLYVAGAGGAAFDTTVVAYTSAGRVRWTDTDTAADQSRPQGLAVDTANDRVYVTSATGATTAESRAVTRADSASGARAWRSVYAPSGTLSIPGGIAVDPSGGQVDVGLYQDNASGTDHKAVTVAYTA